MDSKLKQIYKSLERMDSDEALMMAHRILNDIIEDLKKLDHNMADFLAGYIFTIVAADGKVRKEEFELVKPIMDALFHMDSDIDDAKQLILKTGAGKDGFDNNEMRENFRKVLNTIGMSNPELKTKLIALAVYISALDGDISRKERAFIESLM